MATWRNLAIGALRAAGAKNIRAGFTCPDARTTCRARRPVAARCMMAACVPDLCRPFVGSPTGSTASPRTTANGCPAGHRRAGSTPLADSLSPCETIIFFIVLVSATRLFGAADRTNGRSSSGRYIKSRSVLPGDPPGAAVRIPGVGTRLLRPVHMPVRQIHSAVVSLIRRTNRRIAFPTLVSASIPELMPLR